MEKRASAVVALVLLGAAPVDRQAQDLRNFAPLPAVMSSAKNPATPARVALGRMLYFETRLSKNHDVSCNTCHPLDAFGVEPERFSAGHRGQRGSRNAPTVYNAAGHFAQFWDGRAATVEEQAKWPILNPVEMAMPDEESVVAVLESIPEYVEAFRQAFPDDAGRIKLDNVAAAIGAFERGLVTPSRWDRYLAGDEKALSRKEKEGLQVFVSTGCSACHMGPYLGGEMFQRAGLAKPWPAISDGGRYEVTHDESDRLLFKVPSLRNIEKTGPYFHNGSVDRLPAAVRLMADYQIDIFLSDKQIELIVAWMHSLTGRLPTDYIKPPKPPPSTPQTPPPDPR